MKDKLAQYKQYKEDLSAELRKYVQDKNNPLDERFEALCECLELSLRNDTIKDIYLKGIYLKGIIGEYFAELGTVLDSEYIAKEIEENKAVEFKEYCCDNFISSMIFDW
jgi:hypothetical protein